MCQNGSNNIDSVLVVVSWEWAANKPIYRGKDAVAINWNSDVFTYKENSFSGFDLYRTSTTEDWTIFKQSTTLAQSVQGGLGYYTDLKVGKKYVAGEMLFYLEPESPIIKGTTYSTNINVEYGHAYMPLTGLSVSVGPVGVGLSWDRGCDTMASACSFKYSR